MTSRSWSRTSYGATVDVGEPPLTAVSYVQNGGNTPIALRRKGIYPDHSYDMTKTTTTHRVSAQHYVIGGNPRSCSTSWFGATPSVGDPALPDLSKALSKLLEKWRSSTFDAGVSIGEGRESARMIFDRLKSIADAARQLRRRNFGGALAALAHVSKEDRRHAIKSMNTGFFANAWLELQYGWKPLINDIYAASEFVKTKPRVGVIRTHVKETNSDGFGGFGYPNGDIKVIVNERRLHLKVTVSEPPSNIERLGLTDPLSIAWELVPFSFVADWFAPIGDTIKAIHAVQAMPVTSYCQTRVRQYKAIGPVYKGKTYYNQICDASAYCNVDHISVSRSVSPTMPSAWYVLGNAIGHAFSAPLDDDLMKVLNGAALVRSQLGNLRQFL